MYKDWHYLEGVPRHCRREVVAEVEVIFLKAILMGDISSLFE